jgi:cyclophilin family peptidyl-prolyl cis-trans isomerase
MKQLWIGVLLASLVSVQAVAAERVKIVTTFGDIELELDRDRAPATVANFLRYARQGAYDGTIFHRVIARFMIQGGGFDAQMHKRAAGAPIRNEADNGLRNESGTIAMARTSDPHSATNQFFINTANNSFLNHSGNTPRGWGYTVFGRVVRGMSVVRRIEAVPTGSRNGMRDVPLEPVVIQRVEVLAAPALGPRRDASM